VLRTLRTGEAADRHEEAASNQKSEILPHKTSVVFINLSPRVQFDTNPNPNVMRRRFLQRSLHLGMTEGVFSFL
jgi:hypothetical protein